MNSNDAAVQSFLQERAPSTLDYDNDDVRRDEEDDRSGDEDERPNQVKCIQRTCHFCKNIGNFDY